MKTMIIGLGPEYNYPGEFSLWGGKQNTRYASNFGASLISRALAKQFDADYVDDFTSVSAIKNKYDCCLIAFANHITNWRDVSIYADIIEKLDMKTVALSLGVQDYSSEADFSIHPSMMRLLKAVSARSSAIGVRGHYTASILIRHGFKNIAPVGCPTVFWGLNSQLHINKTDHPEKPVLVYHPTLIPVRPDLFDGVPLLGQDFFDEVIFNENPNNDHGLFTHEKRRYERLQCSEDTFDIIKRNGVFPKSFDDWFNHIGRADFVFGPRLHGCIAGLVQGIPSMLLARDLRTNEMAEMFDIPSITYSQMGESTVASLHRKAEYARFEETYKHRRRNYISIINENGLKHNFPIDDETNSYTYNAYDVRTSMNTIKNILAKQSISIEKSGDNIGSNIVSKGKKTTALVKRIGRGVKRRLKAAFE